MGQINEASPLAGQAHYCGAAAHQEEMDSAAREARADGRAACLGAEMTERLLQVTAPHFCAGAVWQRIDGEWQCVEAAPILAWMRGKDAREVGAYLRRKGWRVYWSPARDCPPN